LPCHQRPFFTMSFDWAHQFCLACDKQTDGAAYCSESCRLADYEKTSSAGSGPSSPALPLHNDWTSSKPSSSRFYLSPAFDFGHTQQGSNVPRGSLSPSNSHSSLCSMRSNSSSASTESARALSDKATRELRAYNRSLESVRLQRRRSH
jgi:hypothetical protein